MYEIDQEKVEKDFQRVLEWYKNQEYNEVYYDKFLSSFKRQGARTYYLTHITDLSEDFIRHTLLELNTAGYYSSEIWLIVKYQTNLSESFYEDFVKWFNSHDLKHLVINKKFSDEFLKSRTDIFTQAFWEDLYSGN